MDISLLKATPEMTRKSPPRQRQLLVDCSICHTWSTVPTLEAQQICREAKCCVGCMRNDFFLLRIRIVAIEQAMESIAKRGRLLPDDRKPMLRTVYAKKARQLAECRAQLADLEARQ